ncbi:MAG: hypothetical protein ACT4R6_13840 [Gemmatimonadaceae bacterium]
MSQAVEALVRWERLGSVAPESLVDARLQLHHALQVIVSAAISYLEPRADDSHTNLEWLPAQCALGTNWLAGGRRLRFALQPAGPALLAIDDRGATAQLELQGRRVADALAWLREQLGGAGYDGSALTAQRHYEIPAHAVAAGSPFELGDGRAAAELARCYADAHELASLVGRERAGASPPRCWPHHFDLATLITLGELPGRGTRTVGVGLSPGDASYAEPYFYVGPYPHPAAERLPSLGSLGHWHTQGWVGAVLRPSAIAHMEAAEQGASVLRFARTAIDASIAALSPPEPQDGNNARMLQERLGRSDG